MFRVLSYSLMTLALCVCGCGPSDEPTLAPNVTASQQTDASQSMGLTFPAGTRFLLYHRTDGLDDAIWLKIELTPNDLASLLSQPVLSAASWSGTQIQAWNADFPECSEWAPSKVKKYRTAQIRLPKAEVLNVLIDDDPDDVKLVYLFWHQT